MKEPTFEFNQINWKSHPVNRYPDFKQWKLEYIYLSQILKGTHQTVSGKHGSEALAISCRHCSKETCNSDMLSKQILQCQGDVVFFKLKERNMAVVKVQSHRGQYINCLPKNLFPWNSLIKLPAFIETKFNLIAAWYNIVLLLQIGFSSHHSILFILPVCQNCFRNLFENFRRKNILTGWKSG